MSFQRLACAERADIMPRSSDLLALTCARMLDAQHATTLYELYSRDVYRYCYRRLHDHYAAEDC